MPRKYTVEIHRTITVRPQRGNGGHWAAVIFYSLIGLLVVGIVPLQGLVKSLENRPKFENPLGSAPDDDDPIPDVAPEDDPIPDVAPEPVPVQKQTGRQRMIEADRYNQCFIEAFANGERFRFLADTGASAIFFTVADARKLGLDPATLSYDHTYSQWGGKVKGAQVRLREFRIDGLVLKDVQAVIDRTDFGHPLLGSSILKTMNFQVRDKSCVLTLPQTAEAAPSYKPGDRRDMNRIIGNTR